MKKINPWFLYIIPALWFVLGVLYARSLDAWAGIGVVIMVLVSTLGTLVGVITYHITRKWLPSIISAILSTIAIFFLVVLFARFS